MQLYDPAQPTKPLALVMVVACVEKTTNRGLVQHHGMNRFVTVDGADLVRLRPPSTL
jgi:hypothetical protein